MKKGIESNKNRSAKASGNDSEPSYLGNGQSGKRNLLLYGQSLTLEEIDASTCPLKSSTNSVMIEQMLN